MLAKAQHPPSPPYSPVKAFFRLNPFLRETPKVGLVVGDFSSIFSNFPGHIGAEDSDDLVKTRPGRT